MIAKVRLKISTRVRFTFSIEKVYLSFNDLINFLFNFLESKKSANSILESYIYMLYYKLAIFDT